MKGITIAFLLLFALGECYSQYENLNIKLRFDTIYVDSYQSGNKSYAGLWDISTTDGDNLEAEWVYALEGLLKMYETTHDKGYLYEFLKEVTAIVNLRGDIVKGSSFPPLWFKRLLNSSSWDSDPNGNNLNENYNGRVTMVLSHFVFLVKSDLSLSQTSINLLPGEDRAVLYKGFDTFGEYATFLEAKVNETLTWAVNNMWLCDSQCGNLCGIQHDLNPLDRLGEFNFQTPWAISFVYMYASNVNQYYSFGVKAAQIAKLILWSSCNPVTTNALHYVNSTDAYTWLHNPWDTKKTNEDIGHGLLDVWFPIIYNRHRDILYNHVTTSDYFADFHMARLRNTITKQLWNSSLNGFNTGIFVPGNAAEGTPLDSVTSTFDNLAVTNSIFAYMPYYAFDNYPGNTGHSVYSLLMDYYSNRSTDLNAYSSGPLLKGLSDLVAAQWEMENYSSTLQRRNLYYNNDFYAKQILTIDPSGADAPIGQQNFGEQSFKIQTGITSNISAGDRIVIKPGFKALEGSNVNLCLVAPSGRSYSGFRDTNQSNHITAAASSPTPEACLSIYPNPTKRFLSVSINEGTALVTITSSLSVVVHRANINSDNNSTDLFELPEGLYIVTINYKGKSTVKKLVKD